MNPAGTIAFAASLARRRVSRQSPRVLAFNPSNEAPLASPSRVAPPPRPRAFARVASPRASLAPACFSFSTFCSDSPLIDCRCFLDAAASPSTVCTPASRSLLTSDAAIPDSCVVRVRSASPFVRRQSSSSRTRRRASSVASLVVRRASSSSSSSSSSSNDSFESHRVVVRVVVRARRRASSHLERGDRRRRRDRFVARDVVVSRERAVVDGARRHRDRVAR